MSVFSGEFSDKEALLELDRVTVVRGQARVLHELSLKIALGQHTVILGPNGCGKSSFIKLITRELYPLARLDGSPIKILGQARWHVGQLRSMLGIVTGDLAANLQGMPRLTVKEAVLSGYFASFVVPPHVEITAAMRERVPEVLEQVGALHLMERALAELSTGEARRVLIARALVGEPQALLLDEPTTGLDVVAQQQLVAIMQDLAARGITLVLVTHHLEEIVPAISRVILMRAGKVFADGGCADLLSSEVLSEVFGGDVEVRRDGEVYRARAVLS